MRKLTARALPFSLPGYPDYLAALLHARGIKEPAQAKRFLQPALDQLHDPLLMHGVQQACKLLRKACDEGWVCAVYGDYDADGVCASAILLEAFECLGLKAFAYIPDRQSEGYGLNAQAVRQLAAQARLLISVDCGITAVAEAALARELGMQVIITDHHSLPEELPQADALVHPHLGDYPEKNLCGAGVAWKLACALIGLDKALGSLDLAALATVADLVPLLGENRVIVSLGLDRMRDTHRVGLKELFKLSGIREGSPISSEHIAYQLAPRLNAGGRLDTAQDALSLLITNNPQEAGALAGRLELLNRERRQVELQVLKEASALLQGQDFSACRSLVVAGEGWNPGVVGLTAGKLAERWNYPSLVLTAQGEEYAGSGRSAGGIDLYAALKSCEHLLTRFGGHKMAAGLALPKDKLEEFTASFDAAVRDQLGQDDLIPETVYDTALALRDINLETVSLLDQLAPFGLGNPAPQFLMEDLQLVSGKAVGSEKAHLKLTVASQGVVREGIAFGQGPALNHLGRQLSLVGSVDRNDFMGKVTAQLKVRALLPGQEPYSEDAVLAARALIAACPAQPPVDGQMPVITQLEQLPALEGTRGCLLLAYSHQTANQLHQRYPDLACHTGQATDPRGFHAIVYAPDFSRHFAQFSTLVFADGLPGVYTANRASQATGAFQVQVLPPSPALRQLKSRLAPSLEELRQVYQALKQGQTLAFTNNLGKDLLALAIYQQLGLVELNEDGYFQSLLPFIRIAPQNSPLFCALQE